MYDIPDSISFINANTYCTASSFVTFLNTLRNASQYAGPFCKFKVVDRTGTSNVLPVAVGHHTSTSVTLTCSNSSACVSRFRLSYFLISWTSLSEIRRKDVKLSQGTSRVLRTSSLVRSEPPSSGRPDRDMLVDVLRTRRVRSVQR